MGVMRRLKDAADNAIKAMDGEMTAHAAPVDDRYALMGPAGEVMHGLVKLERSERIKDAGEWERVRRAELAPRDAARQPYVATERPPLRISRIVTRGKTQAKDIAEHLAACGLAGRPDLVYGVYRVPDRIRPSAGPEGRRVVEWDIVHAATAALPPADAPADVFFDAEATWVARRIGEPSILDEDLALAYLERAGIGPELTLGIARHVTIAPRGGTTRPPTRA